MSKEGSVDCIHGRGRALRFNRSVTNRHDAIGASIVAHVKVISHSEALNKVRKKKPKGTESRK